MMTATNEEQLGMLRDKALKVWREQYLVTGLLNGGAAVVLVRADEPAFFGRVVPLLVVMIYVTLIVSSVVLRSAPRRWVDGVPFVLGSVVGAGLAAVFLPTAVANFMLLPVAFWMTLAGFLSSGVALGLSSMAGVAESEQPGKLPAWF